MGYAGEILNCCIISQEEDEETEKENQGASSESDVMAHPLAERLDILMTILFAYIKEICYVNGNKVWIIPVSPPFPSFPSPLLSK